MGSDPLHWLPGSFNRRPEWRLPRAEHLLATGRRRDPRVDDEWVAHARAALRGGRDGGTRAGAVRAAREVWVGDPTLKGELEARLLTDEPLDARSADSRRRHPQSVAGTPLTCPLRVVTLHAHSVTTWRRNPAVSSFHGRHRVL